MYPSGELADGLEPHGQLDHASVRHGGMVQPSGQWGGVPGVVQWGGYLEGAIPGTTQPTHLRLI